MSTAEAALNLLDVAWIPVRQRSGSTTHTGLRDLFSHAREIEGLAETSPPNLVALHRLLLAITHRALCQDPGTWTDFDRARWWRTGLPVEAIHNYLETWRERFWLFHPTHPFMQVSALAEAEETREKPKPWTQVALDSANGNTPVVFDHAVDIRPSAIDPLLLLRHLLGFLQFTPGGLVKVFRSADKAGPLVNTASAMPQGQTLHETLLLGLHPHNAASATDLPSWERPPPIVKDLLGDPLPATGPCDRYTRISRSVLLQPPEGEEKLVRWIRFGAGLALLEDDAAPDPMSSYRAGAAHLVRLNFVEGKAVWRDLGALLPDPTGKSAQPAAILSWAINLVTLLDQSNNDEIPVILAGLTSDKAKLLRWRSEHFRLPASALGRADVALLVRDGLAQTEDTYRKLRQLAAQMLARTLPDPSSRETYDRASAIVNRGPLATAYFSVAEQAMPDWLHRIGRTEIDEAMTDWNRVLLRAINTAWQVALDQLGHSAAALRAQAQIHSRYLQLLQPLREAAGVAHPHFNSGVETP